MTTSKVTSSDSRRSLSEEPELLPVVLLPELEEELPLFPQEAIRDTDSIAQIREANSLFFIGIILSGGGRCVPSEKSSKLRRRVDPTQCRN